MTYLLIAAAVLAVLILLSNILTPNEKDKKPPAGNCRNCRTMTRLGLRHREKWLF